MSNIAIQFDQVGKLYHLGLVGTGTLSHDLNRWWRTSILGQEDPYLKIGETNDRSKKGSSDFVWALKDISFDVEQGDVVGIIGKNGAGKSTLLKLLSRITSPTTGTIRAKGRIGSLLEVGTGFHPEMTGRENIYMNGSIMGMTRSEISRKLDEIVDFAGVERYLDTPVKRYSSGMTVRLGFAVAAFMEPEILVVDEVLAVGDAEFQKKAIGKMQDVSQGSGRTVLFVSHNMASVRHLCNQGILLENGSVKTIGSIDYVIDTYMKSSVQNSSLPISEMPRPIHVNNIIHFTDLKFLNEKNEEMIPTCGEFLKVRVFFDLKDDVANSCEISFGIRSILGDPMMSYSTNMLSAPFQISKETKYLDCIIPKLPLTEGEYKIALWAASKGVTCDLLESAMSFNVLDADYYNQGRPMAKHLKGKIVLTDYYWVL